MVGAGVILRFSKRRKLYTIIQTYKKGIEIYGKW